MAVIEGLENAQYSRIRNAAVIAAVSKPKIRAGFHLQQAAKEFCLIQHPLTHNKFNYLEGREVGRSFL